MSSKINLQTCEYARKSSIFQDNQLIYQTPETQGCLRDLYNDSNMLHYSLHSLDIDEIIKVTGEAYELISVLRHNLIKRSRLSERDEFHEWAFPSGQREKMMLMGFPIEKD